jgi:hypothetical protein
VLVSPALHLLDADIYLAAAGRPIGHDTPRQFASTLLRHKVVVGHAALERWRRWNGAGAQMVNPPAE